MVAELNKDILLFYDPNVNRSFKLFWILYPVVLAMELSQHLLNNALLSSEPVDQIADAPGNRPIVVVRATDSDLGVVYLYRR
jgi:hypothetical protein